MKSAFLLAPAIILLSSCKGPSAPDAQKPPPSDTPAAKITVIKDTITHLVTIDTPATPMVAKKWIGSWKDEDQFSGGQLDITNIKGNKLFFSMEAEDGGNTGTVEGSAKLNGYHALYTHTEDGDTCRIEFTYMGDSVYVDQQRGICGAGVGVYYSGIYYTKPPKRKEETLLTLGMLNTEIQDKKFRQLVGDDYKLFVSSSQMVFAESKDLDSLHATVHEAGVNHMMQEKANIILINDHLDIWAAVIDEDSIKYYTTREDYRHRLPRTIDEWQQTKEDKKIIFK